MDVYNLNIPAIPAAFYDLSQKPQNATRMKQIYSDYQNEIDTAVSYTKVPQELIVSIIFIESNGDSSVVSPAGAVGLMQLVPSAANDILVLENIHKRLTAAEQQILRKKMGSRLDGLLKMKFLGQKVTVGSTTSATWVTQQDLSDPMTNILIGAIFLSILIDEERTGSDVRLDKVVVRYNKGYFANSAGKGLVGDINSLYYSLNPESKNYVLKLLGTNGTLDAYANA